MPREKGQPNNPVLRGEDALEVLNALAERETNASHIILGLGQRVLGLEGTSIRSGMDRDEDGRDMPTYAIAFTHPHRDTNFLAFLTSRQTWKPGEHGQLAFGIRIRVKETFRAHTQDPHRLLQGPTSESTGDWYNIRRTDDSLVRSVFDLVRQVYELWN